MFRAFDQRLHVWRAIKLLSPEFASKPKLFARFVAEAQTMAILEHKNLVRVYDVAQDGSYAFIVMELVEGGTLVDWLEQYGPMPPRLAVEVLLQVVQGIHTAHVKGVIHRDIKPHNILIARDGTCKVTDFGIARFGESDAPTTRTGSVMGTWGYMAPEQRSNAKGVDERADVYALAATLYTLVVQRVPMDLFAADRDAAIMHGVHPMLLPVIRQATEYDREGRPASVLVLGEILEALRIQLPENPPGTPPLARSPSATPPMPEAITRLGTILPGDESGGTEVVPLSRPGKPDFASAVDVRGDLSLPLRNDRQRWLFTVGYGAAGVLGACGVLLLVAAAAIAAFVPVRKVEVAVVTSPTAAVVPSTTPKVGGSDVSSARPDSVGSAPISMPTDERQSLGDRRRQKKGRDKVSPGQADPSLVPPEGPSKPSMVPDPAPSAVAEPAAISVPQCLNVLPPRLQGPSSALFKATLCYEDGRDVTLWFRAEGGPWQQRLMPLRLGSHTALISLGGADTSGMEYYVVAGGERKGSKGDPLRVVQGD